MEAYQDDYRKAKEVIEKTKALYDLERQYKYLERERVEEIRAHIKAVEQFQRWVWRRLWDLRIEYEKELRQWSPQPEQPEQHYEPPSSGPPYYGG